MEKVGIVRISIQGFIRKESQRAASKWYGAAKKQKCSLVPVHRHPLAVSAEFALGAGADWPGAGAVGRAAFLERQQLLRAEALVVRLACRFNKILQVRARKEVAQVHEFAVSLVFDIDGAPAVLARAYGLAVQREAVLAAHYSKRDDGLCCSGQMGPK